jgi:predicted chitinase
MLTTEQLQAIMPGLSAKKNAEFLPFLQGAMREFAIDAPARVAAFLAQLAHESGQFRFMEEIWGPTPAQRRYEPQSGLAANLGNTEPGDGKRFKGRGPIQITGRANYRRFGDLLGVGLVEDPARAAVPELAFRIAGLFWSKKGLNELADRATPDAFREITRRINGGFNGLADRQKFYGAACTVLGVVEPPRPRGVEPVPEPAEEPAFERGYEAIRTHVRPPRTRKKASGTGKAKTRRRTKARTATAGARSKTRSTVTRPRGSSSRPPAKTAAAKRSASARSRQTGARAAGSKAKSRTSRRSKSSRRKR